VRKYQHLFFDLDHTLWDFEANSAEAIWEIFTELQVSDRGDIDFEEFILTYRQINRACWNQYRKNEISKETLRYTRFKRALAEYGIVDQELSDTFSDQYIIRSPKKTNLIAGTTEVLRYLEGEKYQMHIITNGFSEVQFVKIENAGLSKYFDVILTSEMVGEKKPHPSVFHQAVVLAEADLSESLMIGDNLEADVIGAREMGMDQVYYNPEEDPHEESITYEIKALSELIEIL
jgi:putative hydrolase of the HAD superfamily